MSLPQHDEPATTEVNTHKTLVEFNVAILRLNLRESQEPWQEIETSQSWRRLIYSRASRHVGSFQGMITWQLEVRGIILQQHGETNLMNPKEVRQRTTLEIGQSDIACYFALDHVMWEKERALLIRINPVMVQVGSREIPLGRDDEFEDNLWGVLRVFRGRGSKPHFSVAILTGLQRADQLVLRGNTKGQCR